MKKIITLMLVAALVLGLAGCSKSDEGRTFKHGFDLDFPPYSHLDDDGSVSGFDVELAKAVCEYLGWKYEPVPFNWDAKDMELNAGSCDCIWSGFTKEGREDAYTWGITYSNKLLGFWPAILVNTALVVVFLAYIVKKDLPLAEIPVIGKYFKK